MSRGAQGRGGEGTGILRGEWLRGAEVFTCRWLLRKGGRGTCGHLREECARQKEQPVQTPRGSTSTEEARAAGGVSEEEGWGRRSDGAGPVSQRKNLRTGSQNAGIRPSEGVMRADPWF